MNCTHYSDHEEAPLSQTRTIGLCGYTINNFSSVIIYYHLLAQLCNLENNLFYVEITRKLSCDNEKTTFVMP